MREKPWHWLSFADDSGFRGVILLRCRDVAEGARISWALDINPGGQIAAWQMPPEFDPPERFKNRLLSKADIIELQGEARSLGELERTDHD